jgi:hypothetical protein
MLARVLVLLSLSLCISAARADEPQWLKDARARESKPVEPREFKSKDKFLKGTAPAKVVGTIEKAEGSYSIEFDIGSEASVYCEVVPDDFDMADMIRRTSDITMAEVEKVHGKIEVREIERLDAGAFGNVPYLAATWIYTANAGKGAMAGGLKQVSMSKNGVGIYCAHVDLGYTKSFQAVASAMAKTLETTAPATEVPYYQEIATMSLGAMKCGVTIATLTRDADGDTRARQTTAFLMPGAAKNVVSQDAIHTEFVTPDAGMINALHVIASNGELTTNLSLKPKDDLWVVDGDLQGKHVNVTLKKDAQPGTWVAQALQLRKLLAGPNPVGAEHTIQQWTSEDPGKLTAAKTKVLAKIDNAHYSALGSLGPMTATMTLDAGSGMANAAEMQMGSQKVKLERVYVEGSF